MNKSFIKAIIKIFILSFLVVFVGSLASSQKPKINFDFLKKAQSEKNPVMDSVKSSLKEKPNNYKLNKQSKIIKSAYADDLQLDATSYIVADFDTGEIIAEKNSEKRVPIASLTKIMTAIVALDLAKPEEEFTISRKAQNQIPTKIGIEEGEKLTLDELLSASLLTSANDATQAIMDGINIKYKEDVFIRAMNLKALYLGLHESGFSNPQGFDQMYNLSSSKDLAIISRYALINYPEIKDKASREYELLPKNSTHKRYDLYNWNGLLGVYPGTFGLKIGNTENAGKTTVVVSKRNNKTLIAVVLGSKSILERDMNAATLLDYGFEKSAGLNKISLNETDFQNKYSMWVY